MGKLIKNHWARLIILTSACCKPSSSQFQFQFQSQSLHQSNPSPHPSDQPSIIYSKRNQLPNKAPTPNRPTSRHPRSLPLAQNLLRLPNQKPRRRRETDPDPASRQRRRRPRLPGLRVAAAMGGGLEPAPQRGGAAAVVAAGVSERRLVVPDDECCAVLCCWGRGVFLGVL